MKPILSIGHRLTASKAIARQFKRFGEVVSDLARRSLRSRQTPATRNGISLLSARQGQIAVTLDIVNALRDERV